ncbi:tetratricopeptide repeat protein [Candidatus Saccharibacteria bacterium]|nr:tetratricopeptide repeat protein [Candidatus Saccharibacteria bacterium]
MLGVLIILGFTIYLAFFFHDKKVKKKERKVDPKIDTQMKKLWTIAQDSMKERKPVRAEKALLTILKFDEKNAAAYNRLGILYAKGQKFDDAIECFEIAQSLDNNPSSLHNAGLIYLETGAFEKAAMAFRQALEMEGDVPARFLALAKAEEKLGNRKAAIEALEAAYDLDHTTTTLRQILAIYESTGDTENATATIARIEAQLAANEAAKKKKLARVRKRPLGPRKKSV